MLLLLLRVPRAQLLLGLRMQVGGALLRTGGFQQMAGILEVIVLPSLLCLVRCSELGPLSVATALLRQNS